MATACVQLWVPAYPCLDAQLGAVKPLLTHLLYDPSTAHLNKDFFLHPCQKNKTPYCIRRAVHPSNTTYSSYRGCGANWLQCMWLWWGGSYFWGLKQVMRRQPIGFQPPVHEDHFLGCRTCEQPNLSVYIIWHTVGQGSGVLDSNRNRAIDLLSYFLNSWAIELLKEFLLWSLKRNFSIMPISTELNEVLLKNGFNYLLRIHQYFNITIFYFFYWAWFRTLGQGIKWYPQRQPNSS